MISVLLYGRNDSHGYNLHRRAALSLNAVAEVLDDVDDEILFVDYNTPNDLPTFIEAISDLLTPKARGVVKVIRVRPEFHERHFAARTDLNALEAISRNIAARRANPRNRWLLSTNTDIVFIPRGVDAGRSLSAICGDLPDGFYHTPRVGIPEALWETLDRMQPRDVIGKIRKWGVDFQLNEIVYASPDILFDGPGDFQLILRSDFERVGGFHEEMLLAWHLDSNFAKRMKIFRGEIIGLQDRVFGYHCDHTRQSTLAHRHNRRENDADVYVYGVTSPFVPQQQATWGAVAETFEEFQLSTNLESSFVDALATVVPPYSDREYTEAQLPSTLTVKFTTTCPSWRLISYVSNYINTLPKSASIVYVGARPETFSAFCLLWKNLGFTGPIYVTRSVEKYLAQEISDLTCVVEEEDAARRADCFIIDFSVPGYHDELPVAGDPFVPQFIASDEDKAAILDLTAAFARLAAFEVWQRGSKQPRRFLALNAIGIRYEGVVFNKLLANATPFTSRITQGYVHSQLGNSAWANTKPTGVFEENFFNDLHLPRAAAPAEDGLRSLSRMASLADLQHENWLRWADTLMARSIADSDGWNREYWETAQFFSVFDRLGYLNETLRILFRTVPTSLFRLIGVWCPEAQLFTFENELRLPPNTKAIVLLQNIGCAFGAAKFAAVLAFVDRMLQVGGVCYMSLDLNVFGERDDRYVDLAMVRAGLFDEVIERYTGLRLRGPLDRTMTPDTAGRFTVEGRDDAPHLLYIGADGRILTSLVLVYEKIRTTSATEWERVDAEWTSRCERAPAQGDDLTLFRAVALNDSLLAAGDARKPMLQLVRERTYANIRRLPYAAEHTALVPFDGTGRLALDLHDDRRRELACDGQWRVAEFAHTAARLMPGAVVLDFGAYDGLFSIFSARKIGAHGLVYAFESDVVMRSVMARNIAMNNVSSIRELAVDGDAADIGTRLAQLKLPKVDYVRIDPSRLALTDVTLILAWLRPYDAVIEIDTPLQADGAAAAILESCLRALADSHELYQLDAMGQTCVVRADATSGGRLIFARQHKITAPAKISHMRSQAVETRRPLSAGAIDIR